MTFKKQPFIGLAALLAAGISVPTMAQEEIVERDIEEVVVTGIRQSLRDAIDIKRSYVGTMEAISAEDFGKFPDGNVAESLARVPGIAIDRSNLEGERIAVRGFGPEFNLVTLNGRLMPTAPGTYEGGRSFNFGDIASPGISAVEVFKSVNSALPSGGIGATVNMVTTKPLEINGTSRSLSFNLLEDTTSEAGKTPFESALLYATNMGDWGFSLSGSYQQRQNRETGTREANWITVEEMAAEEGYFRVDPSNPAYVNNNQRADGNHFYSEPSMYLIKDNDRTRLNAQATLQYAWSDTVTSTLDYTYSNVDFSADGMLFGSWLGGWDTQEAIINENGVFTDVVVGNRTYDHTALWQELENDNNSIGFNTEWQVTDTLTLEFDAHHSTAEVIGGDLNSEIGFSTDNPTVIRVTGGGADGVQTFTFDRDFAADEYLATNALLRDGYKENVIDQFQFTGEWVNPDFGFLNSINFGVAHTQSDYQKVTAEGSFGSQGTTAADYDDALFQQTQLGGDFMNSFDVTPGMPYYYNVNFENALAAFEAANPGLTDTVDGTLCCTAGDIDSNERVNETMQSAFIQFNMQTELGDMPLNIVAGLRYEASETESVSLFPVSDLLRWDMVSGLVGVTTSGAASDAPAYGENSLLLPSVAFALALDDEKVLRLSASKSMARPDIVALRSEFAVGNRDFFIPTAEAGNPDLNPLQATNFDVSFENYYGDESYFAVNYFIKDISDFVGSRTSTGQSVNGLTNPAASANAQLAMDCVRDWVDAGRPAPGFPGDPGATGDCVSQQALWAQGWMNDQQHMGWVAIALENGVDVSNGYPWDHGGACPAGSGGWWVCDPAAYIDGTANDPVAGFEVTQPYNMNSGRLTGIELAWQHIWEDTPYGMVFNYTLINGGDVDADRDVVGEQFVLPGFGDSGNISFFYEDDRHTARVAVNYRAETLAGFANFEQPLYVEAREQVDLSYQFRYNDSVTLFADAQNVTDTESRLFVREEEMLFLSQDHGPIYRFGVRSNF